MYRSNKVCHNYCPVVDNDVRVNKRAYDSFKDCGFEYNEFGSIRSDFASLVHSQSLLVMNNAAQRLRELRAVEPDNSKKSFDQIIAEVRPRWMQTPKQIMEFEDFLLNQKLSGLEDIQKSIEEKRLEEAEQKRIAEANAAVSAATAADPE